MTTPRERTLAVVQTRDFLRALAEGDDASGIAGDIRLEARMLLRHFPLPFDLELAARALPAIFGHEWKNVD